MAKKAAPKGAETKGASAGRAKPATKAEIYSTLAEKTGLTRKQVAGLFEAYIDWAKKQLSKRGPGVALLPGLGKVKAVYKPATKASQKPNPFKPGEMMTVKAKPASTRVKMVALKAFRDEL